MANPARIDPLRRLIDVYGADHRALSNARVDRALARGRSLLIFGAGQNGAMVGQAMREAGLTPAAFIDDTPAKRGQSLDGVPIMTLEAAAALPRPVAVISIFNPGTDHLAMAERLRRHGVASIPLFAFLWAHGAARLPFYFLDSPERLVEAEDSLCWLAERLVDAESFDLLCGHVEFRLSLRYDALPPWSAARAPPPPAWSRFQVIDAGAFDGDTLIPLLRSHGPRIQRAVALEPDPDTFERLRANIRALGADLADRTTLVRAAVDQQVGVRTFANAANAGSSFAEAGIAVDAVSIDSVVEAALDPGLPLYIKYDVEGAEAAALRGGAGSIRRRRPMLSVAAYHRPSDLWDLARIICDIDDGYRFTLRAHGADGADLNLYAAPPS